MVWFGPRPPGNCAERYVAGVVAGVDAARGLAETHGFRWESPLGLAANGERAADTSELSWRRRLLPGGALVAVGVVLGGLYFPMLFSRFQLYDDEGVFLVSLRQLLHHHGSLYAGIWADKYGPFYYLFASSIYRMIGQDPSLENGRWIVLLITVATAGLFGAAVWRVTRNLACSILCEVASFLVLVGSAGNEPMHPGSLAVLLVALVAYALSSYAVSKRSVWLFVLGGATGAVLMTKINVGLFVVVAIVTVFVAGNELIERRLRLAVVVLAAVAPFVVMFQRLSAVWAGTFALLVAAAVVGISASIVTDMFALAPRAMLAAGYGLVSVMVVSVGFALVTGTTLHELVNGVFIEPFRQADELTIPAAVAVNWFTIVVTVVFLYLALGTRPDARPDLTVSEPGRPSWRPAALAIAGLTLLGLETVSAIGLGTVGTTGWNLGQWLPALALLPALAIASAAPEPVRFALRSLALVAVFQVLVAYPVAGSGGQIAWATAAMAVPCAIALAAGIDQLEVWTRARVATQVLVAGMVGLALIVASAAWPPTLWQQYTDNTSLNLPGAGLIRVDPRVAQELQSITADLRRECDTFYSVPAINSFYLFSGIPPLTGLVANYPGGLVASQQRQVVKQMQNAALHERVCVLRDDARAQIVAIGYGVGPLHRELIKYQTVVATAGTLTITKETP